MKHLIWMLLEPSNRLINRTLAVMAVVVILIILIGPEPALQP